MTVHHIHPLEQNPAAKAEAMNRLARRCLASLAQFRKQDHGKDSL